MTRRVVDSESIWKSDTLRLTRCLSRVTFNGGFRDSFPRLNLLLELCSTRHTSISKKRMHPSRLGQAVAWQARGQGPALVELRIRTKCALDSGRGIIRGLQHTGPRSGLGVRRSAPQLRYLPKFTCTLTLSLRIERERGDL